MKKSSQIFFLLALVIASNSAKAQEVDYSSFCTHENVGKEISVNDEFGCHHVIYLGEIVDSVGNKWGVLRDFHLIDVAIGKRGKSLLVFYDPENKIIKQYHVDMPDELPVKISGNFLIFQEDESLIELKLTELGKIICFPSGCYTLE